MLADLRYDNSDEGDEGEAFDDLQNCFAAAFFNGDGPKKLKFISKDGEYVFRPYKYRDPD